MESSSCRITIFCFSSSSRCRASCREAKQSQVAPWGPLGARGVPRSGSLSVCFLGSVNTGYVAPRFLITNNPMAVLAQGLLSREALTACGAYLQVAGQLYDFLEGKGEIFQSTGLFQFTNIYISREVEILSAGPHGTFAMQRLE